jgi:response regulator of citrate/malate metabolism
MIRTLVVDDDYRVARIHAASVERIAGFTCVGQAHTVAEAKKAVAEVSPDLLLLDFYLPDGDGLSLLRDLNAADGATPDCIVITAARDLTTVRSAMHLGAIYYLVKPFGLPQLRHQLDAYRLWRAQTSGAGEADQATVDALYTVLRGAVPTPSTAGMMPPTMRKILDEVRASVEPADACTLADRLGVSRPTAQRYLSELHRRGVVELHLEYGRAGRPVHRYAIRGA